MHKNTLDVILKETHIRKVQQCFAILYECFKRRCKYQCLIKKWLICSFIVLSNYYLLSDA